MSRTCAAFILALAVAACGDDDDADVSSDAAVPDAAVADAAIADAAVPDAAAPDAEPDHCPRPTAGAIAPGDTVSGMLTGDSTTSIHTYLFPDTTFGDGPEVIYELDLDHRADIVWQLTSPGDANQRPYAYIRQDCDATQAGQPLYDLHTGSILTYLEDGAFHESESTWFDAPPGHYYLFFDARQAVDTPYSGRVTLREIVGEGGSCAATSTRCDEHEGLGCDAQSHLCVHHCDLRFDNASSDRRMPQRCDDGNAVDGDGCNHRCEFEGITEKRESIEPNDTPAQAQAVPSRVEIHGHEGDSDDVFAVQAVPGDIISAEIVGTDTVACASSWAIVRQKATLELRGPDGTASLTSATITRQDWLGLGYNYGTCPLIAWPVQEAGTYYVVESSTLDFTPTMHRYADYRLRIRVEHPSYATLDIAQTRNVESSSYLPDGVGGTIGVNVNHPGGALVVAFEQAGPADCASPDVSITGGDFISAPPPDSTTSCWLENFVINEGYSSVIVNGPSYIAILPR